MPRREIPLHLAGQLEEARLSSGAVAEVEGFIAAVREELKTKPLVIVEAELAMDFAANAVHDAASGAAAIAICMLASRPAP